jgi:glycosyltransferase involved in cell wall biosynthesis
MGRGEGMSGAGSDRVSIIVRALNEERWLDAALRACRSQRTDGLDIELILVDSGSTDATVDIATAHGCRIIRIDRSAFTFGRSLNWGCAAATGDYLVFLSAHCIPTHDRWLQTLLQPLIAGSADYIYGRQIGHECSQFSERRLFAKYYPEHDKLPQEGLFCNNANAALPASTWSQHQFDEECTGLEDMLLAKQLVEAGGRVGYVAAAAVYHIHEETLAQTYNRYYREALTLRLVMPAMHVSFADFARYFAAGTINDLTAALREGVIVQHCWQIVRFRFAQFWGSYRGNNLHRKLSRAEKEEYYYPNVSGHQRRSRRGRKTSTAPISNQGGLGRPDELHTDA